MRSNTPTVRLIIIAFLVSITKFSSVEEYAATWVHCSTGLPHVRQHTEVRLVFIRLARGKCRTRKRVGVRSSTTIAYRKAE